MAKRKVAKPVKGKGYLEAYETGYKNGRDMEAETHARLNVCIDSDTARELYLALRFTYLSHEFTLVHALLRRLSDV